MYYLDFLRLFEAFPSMKIFAEPTVLVPTCESLQLDYLQDVSSITIASLNFSKRLKPHQQYRSIQQILLLLPGKRVYRLSTSSY